MGLAELQYVIELYAFNKIWKYSYSFIDYEGIHEGFTEIWWNKDGGMIHLPIEQVRDAAGNQVLVYLEPTLVFSPCVSQIPEYFNAQIRNQCLVYRDPSIHLVEVNLVPEGFRLWNWCESANVRLISPLQVQPLTDRSIFAFLDRDLEYEALCLRLQSENLIQEVCGEHTQIRCSGSNLFKQLVVYKQMSRMEDSDPKGAKIYKDFWGDRKSVV